MSHQSSTRAEQRHQRPLVSLSAEQSPFPSSPCSLVPCPLLSSGLLWQLPAIFCVKRFPFLVQAFSSFNFNSPFPRFHLTCCRLLSLSFLSLSLFRFDWWLDIWGYSAPETIVCIIRIKGSAIDISRNGDD